MKEILHKPITASLLWGIIGGALLILTMQIFNKALFEMLPYPLVLIRALVTLKPAGEKKFLTYFNTGLSTFMIMSLILYFALLLSDSSILAILPYTGHFWRIGVMLLIGSASSATLTYLILLKR